MQLTICRKVEETTRGAPSQCMVQRKTVLEQKIQNLTEHGHPLAPSDENELYQTIHYFNDCHLVAPRYA